MNLSVIWRLQDKMTPIMNRVARSAKSTQGIIERVNTTINKGFKRSGLSVDSLNDKLSALRKYRNSLIIGVDDKEIRRANSELNILQNKLNKIEARNARQAGNRGGLLSRMGGIRGIAAGYGLYQAIGGAQNALNNGMELGKSEELFKNFVGNAEKAQGIIDQLKRFSDKNPIYGRKELVGGAAMIAETMGADSVIPLTNMVSKLAQGNTANYNGIITRLQQIKGTGYLQGDELMELLNRGVFGLQEEISRFRGVSLQRFNKLKEAQQISYEDVEAALMRMTSAGGKYDKVLDVINASAFGKWERIKNTVRNKVNSIGQSTSNGLARAMDWVNNFFDRSKPVNDALERLGNSFKPLLNAIYRTAVSFGIISDKGDSVNKVVELLSGVFDKLAWFVNLAGKGFQGLATIFEKYPWTKYALGFLLINKHVLSLTANISTVTTVFQLLAGWARRTALFTYVSAGFRTISAAMSLLWANPVGLVVAGVIALGAAIYYAWNHSETFRETIYKIWGGLKFLWNDAVVLARGAWERIAPVFTMLGEWWEKTMNFMRILTSLAWFYIKTKFESITSPIIKAFEAVKPYVSSFWDWFKDKAFQAMRIVLGVTTLGLSEIAIFLGKRFKVGYNNTAASLAKQAQTKETNDILDKFAAKKKKDAISDVVSIIEKNKSLGNSAAVASGSRGAAALNAAAKPQELSDTVSGNTSKQITINLNAPAAQIYNQFESSDSSQSVAQQISDAVLREINRILITGDRLALE